MKNIIKVRNFNFSYGSNKILKNVNFTIDEGEIVGLLGENGSGKTTLLDCLYGFHGQIETINIFSIIPAMDNPTIKRNVSYIQDNENLLDYLTAQQYLKFICHIEKLSYLDKEKEIFELIELFSLADEYTEKLLKDYSFGMKKKIQIIGEFFLHKPLIIIDEPTNGLDIMMIIFLKELIKKENQNHSTTILISSHNISFLESVCQRVLLFDKKKIVRNINLSNNMSLETEFIKHKFIDEGTSSS